MALKLVTALPTVVYVDDEEPNLQAFAYALMDHAQVITYSTAAQALAESAHWRDVTVIVADVVMAGVDGVEFLEAAAKLAPDAVRILLTAFDDAQYLTGLMNRGVAHRCYDRVAAFQGEQLEQIIAEAVDEYLERAFRRRLTEALPELLDRMAEAGPGWSTPLILARASRALKLARLLLPYLDLSVKERVDLLLAGLFCNLAPEVLGGMPGWEGVKQALADCSEQWDGTGPQRKAGEAIYVLAQILGVVIGFDNWMMAVRKESGGVEGRIARVVLRLRDERETKFSGEVLDVFVQMVEAKTTALTALY